MQKVTALLLFQIAQGGLQTEYCIGYSKLFGEEAPEVNDDAYRASEILSLIQENPTFNFETDIFSDFDFRNHTVANEEYVHCSRMQVKVGNWAEFIAFKSQKGGSLSSFELENFMGLVHGEHTGEEKPMEKQLINSVGAHGVYFDKVPAVSGFEFEQQGKDDSIRIGHSTNNSTFSESFPASETTRIVGLRTTRACYSDRTINSLRFIFISKDSSVCEQLTQITEADIEVAKNQTSTFCSYAEIAAINGEPYIPVLIDHALSETERNVYTVIGILSGIIFALFICILVLRHRLKRLIATMSQRFQRGSLNVASPNNSGNMDDDPNHEYEQARQTTNMNPSIQIADSEKKPTREFRV